jgi:hypothetical protein
MSSHRVARWCPGRSTHNRTWYGDSYMVLFLARCRLTKSRTCRERFVPGGPHTGSRAAESPNRPAKISRHPPSGAAGPGSQGPTAVQRKVANTRASALAVHRRCGLRAVVGGDDLTQRLAPRLTRFGGRRSPTRRPRPDLSSGTRNAVQAGRYDRPARLSANAPSPADEALARSARPANHENLGRRQTRPTR